jgi:hypothetical protein
MKHMPQSMSDFFRAFYYMKGGEFPGNQNLTPLRPMPTAREAAAENARMPEYYVMRRDRGMPATMVAFMPTKEYIANCKWFTQAECDVYGQEYSASGWTGPCTTTGTAAPRLPQTSPSNSHFREDHRCARAVHCGQTGLGRQPDRGRR